MFRYVNGLSHRFSIRNGTRQGCPPLLFTLAVEPYLRVIKANLNIKGVTVGTMLISSRPTQMILYFHLTDPLLWLPNLMQELQLFGSVFNFKINYTKSQTLPITLPSTLTSNFNIIMNILPRILFLQMIPYPYQKVFFCSSKVCLLFLSGRDRNLR